MSIANMATIFRRRDVELLMLGLGALMVSVATWSVVPLSDSPSWSAAEVRSSGGDHGDEWATWSNALITPFRALDAVQPDGIVGFLVSIGAHAATIVLIYKAVQKMLWNSVVRIRAVAAGTAVCLFSLNPVSLHLRVASAADLLKYAALLGATYSLYKWMADTTRGGQLTVSAGWLMLAALTGRDAWPVAGAFVLLVAWHTYSSGAGSRRMRWRSVQDITIVYAVIASAGIIGYAALLPPVFGTTADLQFSEIWRDINRSVATGPGQVLVELRNILLGNVFYAMVVAAAAVVSTVAFHRLRRRRVRNRPIPPVLGVAACPFFGLVLFVDTSFVYVDRLGVSVVDPRFDMLPIIPACILAGYLVGRAGQAISRLMKSGSSTSSGSSALPELVAVPESSGSS